MPQTDHKSKQLKNTVTQKMFFSNQYGNKLAILDT